MCAYADGLNFKYSNLKMFLLKLGSALQNFIEKFQSVLKIKKKCRLHFHEVEYFQKVECTAFHFVERFRLVEIASLLCGIVK